MIYRIGFIALLSMALIGCAYHPIPASVYGRSGSQYQAPDLCAALTKCLQSEKSCYYEQTVIENAAGEKEASGCKEVKK